MSKPTEDQINFKVGQSIYFEKTFTLTDDFKSFAECSQDYNPLHHDQDYAKHSQFKTLIVPIHLATAPLSSIAGMVFPGHRSLILDYQVQAIAPILYDTAIGYCAKIISKNPLKNTLTIRTLLLQGKQILACAQHIVQIRQDIAETDYYIPKHLQCRQPVIQNDNKKALILGASGGIGHAIAIMLAKQQYDLILHYHNNTDAIESLAHTCKAYGAHVETVQANLCDESEIAYLLKTINLNEISLLIHSASSALSSSSADLFASNYTCLKSIADALIPSLLQKQSGNIIYIGSTAMQHYPPGWEHYIAAKASATALINSYHKQYANYGISASTLAPSFVHTSFSADFRDHNTEVLLPEQVAAYLKEIITAPKMHSYFSITPNQKESGHYGFNPSKTFNKHSPITPQPKNMTTESNHCHDRLSSLIREIFQTNSIESDDLKTLPGWDSLAQIKFILRLEKEFDVQFSASNIEQTTSIKALETELNLKSLAGAV